MPETTQNLGRLISSHTTSPAYLQRAAIVAVVSFAFFLGTLALFYLRQQIGYFLLSTGFLVVYIFTLIGWVMQKRNVVTLYENGISYRKFRFVWSEIRSVTANKNGLEIIVSKRERTIIPRSVIGFNQIVQTVRTGVENAR